MDAPDTKTACREVIDAWSDLARLVDFAEKRHGFGNSDGGFGVTYPGDLDEYDVQVEGTNIPDGSVQLYGYAFAIPPGYEILVQESVYLQNLVNILVEQGLSAEAQRATLLLNRLAQTTS
jgi:hypothetical protein